MSKENNLTDFLTDVADAIREKKGTTEKINPQDFSDEIKSIKTSTSMWTGHVDVEGLKAIGWDDDDIAYFQEHGVNWMEEDDEYYKVSDDNKALYGVLTADNIQEYKDRIVWLPKIEGEFLRNTDYRFKDCYYMIGMPHLNFKNVTSIGEMFSSCYSLTCIPPIDFSKVGFAGSAFRFCVSLQYIPAIDTSGIYQSMQQMFQWCCSLRTMQTLHIEKSTKLDFIFQQCYSLAKVEELDLSGVKNSSLFSYCRSLGDFKLKNLWYSINLSDAVNLRKHSLLYLIEHEVATEPIVITLYNFAYTRLSTDPDIVEALNNHPLVSLASA